MPLVSLPTGLLLLLVFFLVEDEFPSPNEAEALAFPKSASSSSFRFPKSAFLVSPTTPSNLGWNQNLHQNFRLKQQLETRLRSTSASAAYLESISYRPPSVEDGLLGATSKYLDALSSVSNQFQQPQSQYQYQYQTQTPTGYSSPYTYASGVHSAAAEAGTTAVYSPESAAAPTSGMPFSEDQLFNDVVQRVTQEFSSTLEGFGGETHDSFIDSASTLIADSMPGYISLDDDTARQGSKAVRNAARSASEASTNPEETLRELTSKLDSNFRSFRENLASSTHSVTSSVTDTLRREGSRPNAAITTVKQSENIEEVIRRVDDGTLSPEALSNNAREAVDVASGIANKALAVELDATAVGATMAFQKSVSETASDAGAAFSDAAGKAGTAFAETQDGFQKSLGILVETTNQGLGRVAATIAETTGSATASVGEVTSSAANALASGASAVQGTVGAAGSSAANAFASGASAVEGTVGATGSSAANAIAKGASSAAASLVTAEPGMKATAGKVSAVSMSAAQGFGMPGNAYGGGGDVAGMTEMVVATILSIPRAVLDATMMETNPNGMNDMMEGISQGLYNDVLVPLAAPIKAVSSKTSAANAMATTTAAVSATPLDQAQAILHSLQMVLGLVVGIPRAALEGFTGQTIAEIQVSVADTDVRALADQLAGFASAVSSVLLAVLKVVANVVSVVMTQTGIGNAVASGSEDLISRLVSFVVQDLLPTIVDGLLIILQQFANLLLEGGSAVLSTL